jgi:hypothetical protein
MLFPATGGVLIDFDYSGTHAKKMYPMCFWAKLPDTERHLRARAGSLLRKEHDCFSLGAVLAMYECVAEREWKEVIRALQSARPELGSCLALLRCVGSAGVRWTKDPVVDCFGDLSTPAGEKTSSPPKAYGRRDASNQSSRPTSAEETTVNNNE